MELLKREIRLAGTKPNEGEYASTEEQVLSQCMCITIIRVTLGHIQTRAAEKISSYLTPNKSNPQEPNLLFLLLHHVIKLYSDLCHFPLSPYTKLDPRPHVETGFARNKRPVRPGHVEQIQCEIYRLWPGRGLK